MEEEPYLFFAAKNLVFVALIVGLSYLLATYKGLPNVLIIMAVLTLVYDFVTRRTTIGRRIYALGGNEKAARLSGVKTRWLSFLTFVNMGMLAAVAGLVFAARLNTATPKAGTGFELDVIAACFIGGASASGGVGMVLGAVIGALRDGRDEQRHVDPGHRHRLPAGDQGPRAARGGLRRRVQQEQVAEIFDLLGRPMTPREPRIRVVSRHHLVNDPPSWR